MNSEKTDPGSHQENPVIPQGDNWKKKLLEQLQKPSYRSAILKICLTLSSADSKGIFSSQMFGKRLVAAGYNTPMTREIIRFLRVKGYLVPAPGTEKQKKVKSLVLSAKALSDLKVPGVDQSPVSQKPKSAKRKKAHSKEIASDEDEEEYSDSSYQEKYVFPRTYVECLEEFIEQQSDLFAREKRIAALKIELEDEIEEFENSVAFKEALHRHIKVMMKRKTKKKR